MYRVGHLLAGEGVADDVGVVDGRVLHVDAYLVAQQLLVHVPRNGVAVHRHARVLRVVHQRVADGLQVAAVGTHLVVGVNLAVDGVCADVEGEYLERVGMHVERVLLREVDGHGALGGHGVACRVVVFGVVARQHVLVHAVGVDDVPVGIVGARLGVVVDAVADERLAAVPHDRAPEEFRLLRLGVVVAVFAVDAAGARRDVRRTDDVGRRRAGVVVQRVCRKVELLVLQLHVVVEHGLL